ncbi:hypothetical protein ABKV19_026983 [Rosa sericea]
MFNLDSMIPKLCQIAQEMREDGTAMNLRAAGLQALSSMVWFMGEFSHISTEFDNVVSVVLENYGGVKKNSEQEEVSPSVEPMRRIPSWRFIWKICTKVQSSVAIIGALSDMMRHLRKSIHCSLDDSNLGTEVIEWN